jgi:hypothetical protein
MINLHTPLSLRTSFMFPLQSAEARREVLWGAALLVIAPGFGWVLNMGHRIQMVHNMLHGRDAWPAWRDYPALLKHGFITLGGMIFYYLPGLVCLAVAWRYDLTALVIIGLLLLVAATIAIPGYMTHYCVRFDPSEIFNPFKALRRCMQSGRSFWHAWGIALAALAISFVGLLAFGVGFLVTSVWFWQVAGFSFAVSFSRRYGLSGVSRQLPVVSR